MVDSKASHDQSESSSKAKTAQSNFSPSEICYICGASSANWPLHSKLNGKTPYFPFLDSHEPPSEAKSVDKETGKVNSCTVCFSFLTQQWFAFEASETPIAKRIYWLKRPGDENQSSNTQKKIETKCNVKSSLVENTELGKTESTMKDKVNGEVSSEVNRVNHALVKTGGKTYKESSRAAQNSQMENIPNANTKRGSSLEVCYICGRQKPKEFMRSVHTRPQLKTETPFYPCLAKHTPPTVSKKMDFLGKVLVCEACQKFLFRQWQVFQRNNTPLSERQYQLRSDPSLPRDQQSSLSTMVCFICGVTQPATSGRFLYARKHTPGDPYYPFLNNLKPPSGSMPLTKQGLTRACSGCRKSLHRQWKAFENAKVMEVDRHYRIRNEIIMPSSSDNTPCSTITTTVVLSPAVISGPVEVACYTCGHLFMRSSLRLCHSKVPPANSRHTIYFPFISTLEIPKYAKLMDEDGRVLICKTCFSGLQIQWESYEKENIPQKERSYQVRHTNAEPAQLARNVCYLCGFYSEMSRAKKLHSYPHIESGEKDGGPFFPFLAKQKSACNALPLDSEGTILVCQYCEANLLHQWQCYENSCILEEANRWGRKYAPLEFFCNLCTLVCPRDKVRGLHISYFPFLNRSKAGRGCVRMNDGQEVLVCEGCHMILMQQWDAFEKGGVPETSRDYQLAIQGQTVDENPEVEVAPLVDKKLRTSRRGPGIIVIDSSDSDEEHGVRRQHSTPPHVSMGRISASSSLSLPPVSNQDLTSHLSITHPMQSASAQQSSFAAALRKLAKEAMSPGATSPAPPGVTKSPSPGVAMATKGHRIPLIKTSASTPHPSHHPPHHAPVSMMGPHSGGDRHHRRGDTPCSPGMMPAIRTPPMPPIPALEMDHNHRGSGMGTEKVRNSDILGGVLPHVLSPHEGGPVYARHQGQQGHQGHQVLPGVFSIRPKGLAEERMHPTHDGYPPAHFPHPGDKLEPPVFPPRSAGMVAPPPLVANKHGEPEHGYPPHFPPHPFYQQGMDTSGMTQHEIEMRNYESWRQRRKIDHIRQQEERMTGLPGEEELLDDMHQQHQPQQHENQHHLYNENKHEIKERENHTVQEHTLLKRPESKSPLRDLHQNANKENNIVIVDAKAPPSSRSQMPVIHSVYYYNEPKSSCPVHGGVTTMGQSVPKSTSSPRVVSASEYLHGRTGDAENHHHAHHHHSIMSSEKQHHPFMHHDKHHPGFLPPDKHPFHPLPVPNPLGRDAPVFYRHPLDRRPGELEDSQRREEHWMMETRMILEQKHRMKMEEEEWQRRQTLARQEKQDHHRDALQFRQHLLHQKDIEKRDSFGSNPDDKDHDQRHHIQALPPETYRVRELDFRSDPRHQFENMHPHLPRDFHGRPFGSHLGLPIEPHPGMHHMDPMRGMGSPQRHDYYYGGGYGGYYPPHAPPRPLSLFDQEQFRRSLAAIERPPVSEWFSSSKHTFTNGEASVSTESTVKSSDRPSLLSSVTESQPVVIKEEKIEEAVPVENDKIIVNNHIIDNDPKKVKFLQGLGLITFDEIRDKSSSVATLKRPSEEDLEDLLSGEPGRQHKEKRPREEDESSEEGGGTDAESSTDSLEGEIIPKDCEEKLTFMAHLGLVPPKRKKELEVDLERKREERRIKKTRGRPKKGRKEEKKEERSRTPYDVDFLTGPMTRQKQQLMQEQGLILEELQKTRSSSTTPSENGDGINSSRDSSSSSVTIKQEKLDKDERYPENSSLSMHPSPPTQAYSQNIPRPQLTLQSLTNMEDPFNSFNVNSFRPPYLRHTGLLSLKEQSKLNSHGSSSEHAKGFLPVSEPHRNSSPHSSNRQSTGLLGLRPVSSVQENYMRTFVSTHSQQDSGFRNVISGSHDSHHRHSAFKSYNSSGAQLGSGVKETHCTQTTPSIRENKGRFKWPGIEAVMNSYLAYSDECSLELDVLHDSMENIRGRHNNLNDQAEKLNHKMTNLAQLKRNLSEEGKMLREKLDNLHSCLQSFKTGVPHLRKDL